MARTRLECTSAMGEIFQVQGMSMDGFVLLASKQVNGKEREVVF